jgi:murein L,D-transpeptidase YcbB/YkuD
VRRFQTEQGFRADGIVDTRTLNALNIDVETRIRQLKLVMERWRWLPDDPGRRRIRINIASADLNLFEGDAAVLSMRVIVGRSYRQTPSLSGTIDRLTINPTWTVPRTIAVEDLLPQQQRIPSFLASKHIRVFSLKDNREVDAGDIDWQALTPRTFNYQLRQDAGRHNSLGRLKFSFDNPYDIYLHDTPSRILFRLPGRAFSAGCVRLEDPRALAHYLLGLDDLMSPDELERAIDSGRTRTVELTTGVPVYLVYLTAWVDAEGGVHFRDDVYSRDAIIGEAWVAESARRMAALGG